MRGLRKAPSDRPASARLALACVRHHRLVLLAWLLLLGAGLCAVGPVMDRLDRHPWSVAAHESVRGNRLMDAGRSFGGQIDAVVAGAPVSDPGFQRELAAVRDDVSAIAGVMAVNAPVGPRRHAPEVSADGEAALISVRLRRALPDGARTHAERAVEARLRRIPEAVPGLEVTLGGSDRARRAVAAQSLADTRRSEMITLPLTLAVVYVLFGGLVAASVPVVAAVCTVGTGMLWLLVLSRWYDLTSPALSTTTMVGLGLAIDYALLTVGRFREERAAGHEVPESVVRTMDTAGRAILFAALIVAAALCGLAAFPSDFFAAIGLATAGTVALSLAAALTLTPALLAAFPQRIGACVAPDPDFGTFARLARRTRRHALPVAVGVGVLLLACATPFLRVHLVSPVGERQLPPAAEARRYADAVAERFPQHRPDAVVVVARTEPARLAAWAQRFADRPDVESVGAPAPAGPGVAVLRIVPKAGAADSPADRLVRHIRAERPAGFPVWVTGRGALDIDFRAEVVDHAPQAAALIALTTFVLLLMMTGSLLLPLKAIVMNTLSLGASFGALVLVFQDGWGSGVLGVHTLGGLGYWLPVVVFALAFGLSMDYEVFLLARIQECHDSGLDNDRAVEVGVQRSARIISSSAALMCMVFIGFATGELMVMKQLATALAIAVAVDATLVRCLLVPATMTLLRNANWWAPPALRRAGGFRSPPVGGVPRCLAADAGGGVAGQDEQDGGAEQQGYEPVGRGTL